MVELSTNNVINPLMTDHIVFSEPEVALGWNFSGITNPEIFSQKIPNERSRYLKITAIEHVI